MRWAIVDRVFRQARGACCAWPSCCQQCTCWWQPDVYKLARDQLPSPGLLGRLRSLSLLPTGTAACTNKAGASATERGSWRRRAVNVKVSIRVVYGVLCIYSSGVIFVGAGCTCCCRDALLRCWIISRAGSVSPTIGLAGIVQLGTAWCHWMHVWGNITVQGRRGALPRIKDCAGRGSLPDRFGICRVEVHVGEASALFLVARHGCVEVVQVQHKGALVGLPCR